MAGHGPAHQLSEALFPLSVGVTTFSTCACAATTSAHRKPRTVLSKPPVLDRTCYNWHIVGEKMRDLHWMGSSRKDLSGFPEGTRRVVGFGLYQAQLGQRHLDAKPLRGFKGARVLELVMDESGDAYRVVYTTKFKNAVYVLHAFKKKSTRGRKTADHDIELIRARLAAAEKDARR